jgi:hypothetical protein
LSKADFGRLSQQVEGQLDLSSPLVQTMTSLHELKKMNDGWLDETKLDRWDLFTPRSESMISFCFVFM